jgi:hypothetical protein
MSREVSDYIKSEQSLIQSAELNKLIRGIGTSHSVGQAQVLSTLAKLAEQKPMKEGPAFVYCYIPLSPEQIQAPAVRVLDKDPFIKERR